MDGPSFCLSFQHTFHFLVQQPRASLGVEVPSLPFTAFGSQRQALVHTPTSVSSGCASLVLSRLTSLHTGSTSAPFSTAWTLSLNQGPAVHGGNAPLTTSPDLGCVTRECCGWMPAAWLPLGRAIPTLADFRFLQFSQRNKTFNYFTPKNFIGF